MNKERIDKIKEHLFDDVRPFGEQKSEIKYLLAALERVTAERDAAVKDIEKLLLKSETCFACAYEMECYEPCTPKWCGFQLKEESK
jgi:transposase